MGKAVTYTPQDESPLVFIVLHSDHTTTHMTKTDLLLKDEKWSTVSTLLSELGRPDYLSPSPISEMTVTPHLSLSYLFFYINTLVGCASIGLKSKVAGTECVLEPVRTPMAIIATGYHSYMEIAQL